MTMHVLGIQRTRMRLCSIVNNQQLTRTQLYAYRYAVFLRFEVGIGVNMKNSDLCTESVVADVVRCAITQ